MDPAIVLFGFGIGFLVGMTGMGGGSLMTPLLILLFGIQPVTAIGTDIFYSAVTKTVGGWRHLRMKTVNMGLSLWLAAGSVPASIAGVWLIDWLQRRYGEDQINDVALSLLGSALLVVGVIVLLRNTFFAHTIKERKRFEIERRHKVAAVVIGAVTGFVIGLTSAGSGTLIAIMLIAVYRLAPRQVVGTDVFHAALLLWAAGIAHWVGGNVDFGLAGNILVGSVPGVVIGSHVSGSAPLGFMRSALGVVLTASSLALFNKAGAPVPKLAIVVVPAVLTILLVALDRRGSRRESRRLAATSGA
jgi:uncharacterized membrane protein YfcA